MSLDIARTDPALRGSVAKAAGQLEAESYAMRLAAYAGAPVNKVMGLVPGMSTGMRQVVHRAMMKSLEIAVDSLEEEAHPPSRWLPKAMTGFTGGLGGLFGAIALPVELPLTTTLMLRSIADIGRHHGEDMTQLEARLACLEVFALGGRKAEAGDDIGYYAARALFAKLSSDVVAYVMERSVIEATVPVITRLVSAVGARFGVVVSERAAASAVPILGAVSGATLNVIFMDHFERVAHGHFTLRKLERQHGQASIQVLFNEALAAKNRSKADGSSGGI